MNISDITRHYFHVWLRYQISLSDKGQIGWTVLHNLWGDDPLRQGESYTKAWEQLFNFVAASHTQLTETNFEKEVIINHENLDIFKRLIVIFKNQNFEVDIDTFDNLSKFFKNSIYDGMCDEDFDIYMNDVNFELKNYDWNMGKNDLLPQADLKENEADTTWTIQNIILSKELIEIVKSKKVLTKLSKILGSITKRNKSTIRSVIGVSLKKLRKLYFSCLRQTANKRIEASKVDELILSFTNRKLSEVKEKFINEILSESESSSNNYINIRQDVEMDSNYELKVIFYNWLEAESSRLNSKIPNDLKNLIEEINQNHNLKHIPLNEEILEWFDNLDRKHYYDFLKGKYDESTLVNLMKQKNKNLKIIKNLIKELKLDIEDKVLKSFVKLSLIEKEINLKRYAHILGGWLHKRKDYSLSILQSRVLKSTYSINNNSDELIFKKACLNGIRKWNEIYKKKHLRDYKLWGICFKITFKLPIYLVLNKNEINLLKRLWVHMISYEKERLSDLKVIELKDNKYLKDENYNQYLNIENLN